MPVENTTVQKRYPYSDAQSTGTNDQELLCSLLAAGTIDEISSADDFEAVERYITNQAPADESGNTRWGLVFWLYPTGMYGPYHETDDGRIEQHGTLITLEKGVSVAEGVRRARAALRTSGLGHEHIAAS